MSNQNHPDLSIVIPARNEAERLPPTLVTLATWLAKTPFNVEVLVVVEPSRDRTLELAQQFASEQPRFRVLDYAEPRGKGFAVKTGMLAARGEVIFFMDADLSVPIATVDVFWNKMRGEPNLDVLIGNRQHAGSQIVKAQGWLRRGMGQTFNRIVRFLSGIPFHDTQCGFKAFRRVAAQDLFARQSIDGFAFDVEILLLAQKQGYRIQDCPVEWHNSEDSHVHIVHDSLRMLQDVIRLRRKLD